MGRCGSGGQCRTASTGGPNVAPSGDGLSQVPPDRVDRPDAAAVGWPIRKSITGCQAGSSAAGEHATPVGVDVTGNGRADRHGGQPAGGHREEPPPGRRLGRRPDRRPAVVDDVDHRCRGLSRRPVLLLSTTVPRERLCPAGPMAFPDPGTFGAERTAEPPRRSGRQRGRSARSPTGSRPVWGGSGCAEGGHPIRSTSCGDSVPPRTSSRSRSRVQGTSRGSL